MSGNFRTVVQRISSIFADEDLQELLDDPEGSRARNEDALGQGVANTRLDEPRPDYFFVPGSDEHYIGGHSNTHIILGRDQPSGPWSGHGGSGHTRSGAIALIAGLSPQVDDGVRVSKNTTDDAAMLYVAQKTDVDQNFGLAEGEIGNITNRSAIAMKADGVRIIGREGIKIVTGNAQNTTARSREGSTNTILNTLDSVFTERNSAGGFFNQPAPGIELIAGNNTERQSVGIIGRLLGGSSGDNEVEVLQPVPLGDNLVSCLREMSELISTLNGKVADFARAQSRFNLSIMTHTHPIIPIPIPPFIMAAPSIRLGASGVINATSMVSRVHMGLVAHKLDITVHSINYLRDFGGQWICSENVRTT